METVVKYAKESVPALLAIAALMYFGVVPAGKNAPSFLQGKG